MTDRIQYFLKYFIYNKQHHSYRNDNLRDAESLTESFGRQGLSDLERSVRRLEYMLEHERPVIFPDEKIALIRTLTHIPEIHTPDEKEELGKCHFIHEQGKVCNINSSYSSLIDSGFDARRD